MYGEMSTGGGFGAFTEYEIAAQNMSEAAHCILGSLAKLNSTTAFWVEKDHIKEEMGIIEKSMKEYVRDVYLGRVFRPESAQKTIKSVRKAAPKLEKAAMSARRRVSKDLPKEIQEVAKYAYDFLVLLARKLLDSINEIEKGNMVNAYKDMALKASVKNLRKMVDRFLKLSDDGTIEDPYLKPKPKLKVQRVSHDEFQKIVKKEKEKAALKREKVNKMDLMDLLFQKDI